MRFIPTKPKKIINCMKAKTIRIFMLIYAFNEMIQHNWKKERKNQDLCTYRAQEWLISLNLIVFKAYFPTSVDFALMTSFTILFCLWTFVITFIQHFNWMVLVLDIAAIPCPFTVYHTIFMCSNIKWTTINN